MDFFALQTSSESYSGGRINRPMNLAEEERERVREKDVAAARETLISEEPLIMDAL